VRERRGGAFFGGDVMETNDDLRLRTRLFCRVLGQPIALSAVRRPTGKLP
jgi:hypothetical protein